MVAIERVVYSGLAVLVLVYSVVPWPLAFALLLYRAVTLVRLESATACVPCASIVFVILVTLFFAFDVIVHEYGACRKNSAWLAYRWR